MSLPNKFSSLDAKSRRRTVRYGIIAGNCLLLLVAVIFVVSNRYASPSVRTATVNSAISTARSVTNPLDQVSSSQIALEAAQMTNLPETVAVKNQADSESSLAAVVSIDDSLAVKPQIVTTAQKSKHDIFHYSVQAGETVTSIAGKFGLDPNSIRWSNGVLGEALAPGKDLLIPPGNGIVYKVKAGDTIESISSKYQANKDTFIAVNDAENGKVKVDELVWVANGTLTLPKLRFAASSNGGFFGALYGGNGYDPGYCTWWASKRRMEIGHPLPSNLGNACTWKPRALGAGIGVGRTPQEGAVIWYPRGCPGHVGFVEKKNEDGSFWVSEMNAGGYSRMDTSSGHTGGWGRVSYQLLNPDQFGSYWYIY